MRKKKKTAVWFYPEIDEIDDVDAKQYHRASFSTRNSALNTSLRKPIRMQDFIQLCDSKQNEFSLQLPVSHCVPLKPGSQLQLNPFIRSVQVPLFSQG